jgi:hypothetical protein
LYFFKLTQPLTFPSNSNNLLQISTAKLLYAVKENGGKPDRKTYPLPYGLRNPFRNLKSENPQDYALKPLHEFGFWTRQNNAVEFIDKVYILW